MQKLITSVSLAVVVTAFAATASAVTWSPTGQVAFISDIQMAISQGSEAFNCDVFGSILVTENGDSASVTSLTFSSEEVEGCHNFFFLGLPYDLEVSSDPGGFDVIVKNVVIDALFGFCFGDLEALFDQNTGKINFLSQLSGEEGCRINGEVSTIPQLSYTLP